MTITHQDILLATASGGRHAGESVEVDAEIAYLEQSGLAAGLPAGLGDSQPLVVRGAHRAESVEDLEVSAIVEHGVEHGAHTDTEAVEAPVETDGATVPAPRHSSLPVRLILTSALAVLVVLALAFVALNAVSSSFPTAGPAA